MKTAEQWNEEYRAICANDPAVHGQLLPNPQNIAFLQRVINDARAQGLREAAEIVDAEILGARGLAAHLKRKLLAAAERLEKGPAK